MKTVELSKATASLAAYARKTKRGPVVVMSGGRPVAALIIIRNTDLETATLSTNPKFLALIERSRMRQRTEGGISSEEMRRRLGLSKSPRHGNGRR